MGLFDILDAIGKGFDFIDEVTKDSQRIPEYRKEWRRQARSSASDYTDYENAGINFQRKPADKDMMIQELIMYMHTCTRGCRPPNHGMIEKYEKWARQLGVPLPIDIEE